MKTITNLNSSVYYHGQYWNDIPKIAEYISEKLTGDKNKWWIANFKEKFAAKPFKHALFLNCGDGRWEREFIDRSICQRVTAFDVSPDLIRTAKRLKRGRNIHYLVADANKINFKENSFDLIVNIAALHHVQYLNRLCLVISRALRENGLFISFDFVGPQRNQYPLLNLILMNLANLTLPRKIRKTLIRYPHLPTMLATDPTEAIHSNLIDETISRYFRVFVGRVVGGGIAYELFTHNPFFSKNRKRSRAVDTHIKRVLKIDEILTKLRLVPVFFSFTLSKPDKELLGNSSINKYFQEQENKREKLSQMLYNTYTLKDFIIMFIFIGSWRKRLEMLKRFVLVQINA